MEEDSEAKQNCCDVCGQNLDNVSRFQGPPPNSEDEIITVTYPHLKVVSTNGRPGEKPLCKLTAFCVYDSRGHLCPLDRDVIERGGTLRAAGYAKCVVDEDPSTEGGVPTSGIGPINQWYLSGFDGGENTLIGFTTDEADYYLMQPLPQYKPFMKSIEEKRDVVKLVMEFLLSNIWQSPTYEGLLEWIEIHRRSLITEATILKHALFICKQVSSYDQAGKQQDELLMATPCLRTLVSKSNINLSDLSSQHRRFDSNKNVPKSKAAATPLVRRLFESVFADQISGQEFDEDTVMVDSPRRRRRSNKPGTSKDTSDIPPPRQRSRSNEPGTSKDTSDIPPPRQRRRYNEPGTSKDTSDIPPPRQRRRSNEPGTSKDTSDIPPPRQRRRYNEPGTSKDTSDIPPRQRRRSNEPGTSKDTSYIPPPRQRRRYNESGTSKDTSDIPPPRQRRRYNEPGTSKDTSDIPPPSLNGSVGNVQGESKSVEWIGETICEGGRTYHEEALIGNIHIKRFDFVMLNSRIRSKASRIVQIMYLWQEDDKQMFHARCVYRGVETILGKIANTQELFLVDLCKDFPLEQIISKANVNKKDYTDQWAFSGGKDTQSQNDEQFYYSKLYDIKSGSFEDVEEIPLAETADCAFCVNCSKQHSQAALEVPTFKNGQVHWLNEIYKPGTAVFLNPGTIVPIPVRYIVPKLKRSAVDFTKYPEYYRKIGKQVKGTNIGTPEPFNIGIIEKIHIVSKNIKITVRTFYRPEDTVGGPFATYENDFNFVYWSDNICSIPFESVTGKCYLAYGGDASEADVEQWTNEGPYRFYYTQAYDSNKKTHFEVPREAKLPTITREGTEGLSEPMPKWDKVEKPLACMDLFAGCGAFAEGLRQSGVAEAKWAIENEPNAAHAFKLNHPDCMVYIDDCNQLLNNILTGKKYEDKPLPKKGEVELLIGGPPCQGFSKMNRHNKGVNSKLNNSLVVSFLSFCDYYRPRYIILENVRNFVGHNRNEIFKLTLRCLLEMGYQLSFTVLQLGNYGVPQRRLRVIIVAAAPGCVLPKVPESQNTFHLRACSGDGIYVSDVKYMFSRRWQKSAPYRTITVRDAIADLPNIPTGDNNSTQTHYTDDIRSHFQKMLHNNQSNQITNHIVKGIAPLIQARIRHIPLHSAADWRNLPNIVVPLSDGTSTEILQYHYRKKTQKKGPYRGVCICCTGEKCDEQYRQTNTLIPWTTTHTADWHNNWAGMYGRLEWDGYFETTVTNPDPGGKQGRVLHPDEHRLVSVRECARSQGFPDKLVLYGNIQNMYRQIGNAVPPPLALALGRELQKALAIGKK